jgi:hypothetical protein
MSEPEERWQARSRLPALDPAELILAQPGGASALSLLKSASSARVANDMREGMLKRPSGPGVGLLGGALGHCGLSTPVLA